MKLLISNTQAERRERGYALVMVLFFCTLSLLSLAGALMWTSTTAKQVDRNNAYFATVAAAEAATEKLITKVSNDYQKGGEAAVYAGLSGYRDLSPTTSESSYWAGYEFSDGQGRVGKTYIERSQPWTYGIVGSQYSGLNGFSATYRVISNAKRLGYTVPVTAGLRQNVQVTSIPIFQFAIFANVDLEINPGATMNITGRVHSNAEIYTQPSSVTLTYMSHVTAAGNIKLAKSPLDPLVRSAGPVVFKAEHDSQTSAITLPIGTNNTPAAVHQIVEIPPSTELATSDLGKQRYYNKSDLVVLVSNTTVKVSSGAYNGFATAVPWTNAQFFIATNVSFFNKRENKTIVGTQLDVAKLILWSGSNAVPLLGLTRPVSSVYIADMRTRGATEESGVRLVNGGTLPANGLTVSTPNPAYVQGNYNAAGAAIGSTNTASTKPASIVADAITVLSTAWADANSAASLSSRTAANTTVNAAFLAGIVASNGANYSGGVENFPRFLENWSGKTFTYNGSMVLMFYSLIAKGFWGGNDVYNPPNRNWAFDVNFLDVTKLPPGTPQSLKMLRGTWDMIRVNYVGDL